MVDVEMDFSGNINDQATCSAEFERAREAFQRGNYSSAVLPEGFSKAVLAASRLEQIGTRPQQPRASIIIASYRPEPNLKPALTEVARQAAEVAAEIILIDNGNPEFHAIAALIFRTFLIITPPMQTGCSLARNIGALAARSDRLVFVDDDGLLERGSIRALLAALDNPGAVAVRGKVVPLTDPQLTASHYDLGDLPTTSLITAEGISAWKTASFLSAGGFDPLLAGHEGLALSWKLWRFHGPHGLVYEPAAILYHDFAPDKLKSEAKKQQQQRNTDYLAIMCPRATKLHETRLKHDNHLREAILNTPAARSVSSQQLPVSVLTTVRNGLRWIEDFTQSWKSQSFGDYQLVVVDDGSLDGTADALAALWAGDERLTLVRDLGGGRGAALNTALSHARHDICLIADIDDISIPQRIEHTVAEFAARPECDWLSFVAYTEDNHYRIGFPASLAIKDLSLRSLFGMPASFPTTAFRKSRFTVPFNPELRAGVDCDWVRRNMLVTPGLTGELVQFPAVFYRIHDGQLSATYRRDQDEARRALIRQSYEKILESISPEDEQWIHVLANNLEVTPDGKRAVVRWISGLIRQNDARKAYPRDALALLMQDAYARLRVKQPAPAAVAPAAKPQQAAKPASPPPPLVLQKAPAPPAPPRKRHLLSILTGR